MSEPIYVQVEGQSLRLTLLSKLMFPEDGITKAELLLYWVSRVDLEDGFAPTPEPGSDLRA